jgi:hypothetical protein
MTPPEPPLVEVDRPDPWVNIDLMPADIRDREQVLRACRARGVPLPAWARRHIATKQRSKPATMRNIARLRRELQLLAGALAELEGQHHA